MKFTVQSPDLIGQPIQPKDFLQRSFRSPFSWPSSILRWRLVEPTFWIIFLGQYNPALQQEHQLFFKFEFLILSCRTFGIFQSLNLFFQVYFLLLFCFFLAIPAKIPILLPSAYRSMNRVTKIVFSVLILFDVFPFE